MTTACETDQPEQDNDEPTHSAVRRLVLDNRRMIGEAREKERRAAERFRIKKEKIVKNKSPLNKLAIKLAAENRRVAKDLHDAALIYALYGLLDGFSVAISTIKYCFDIHFNDSTISSDAMHDWMTTPEGMAVAAVESISLIAFSMLANIFDDEDKSSAFKRYIAITWPYCRDTMKGLKNAYKGVRSTLQAFGSLAGQDFRFLMVPVGLVFGVLSALNRMSYRYMKNIRKDMQATNAKLFSEIQGIHATCNLYLMLDFPATDLGNYKNCYILVDQTLHYVNPEGVSEEVVVSNVAHFLNGIAELKTDKNIILYQSEELTKLLRESVGSHRPASVFDEAQCDEFRAKIALQQQSLTVRGFGLLSQAYSGVIDGLYLYMGALGLAVLAPQVFLAMTVCSVIFTVTCIGTRMYEEYDYQRKLIRTQEEVKLALCGKEVEILFAKLQVLSEQIGEAGSDIKDADLVRQTAITDALYKKADEFESQRKLLSSKVVLSDASATLAGLKNGLAAYGAIASVMFAVASINLMFFAPFPPAFLIACVISGMACLVGFLAHSLITHQLHRSEPKPSVCESNRKLGGLIDEIKTARQFNLPRKLNPGEVKDAILGGMKVDPSPQFYFQEAFEVVRSLFSGVKGQKSSDYILNPLQEPDNNGHYHDTPLMLWVAAFSSAVYAMVFSLRAQARGFNKPADDNEDEALFLQLSEEVPAPSLSSEPSMSDLGGLGARRMDSEGVRTDGEQLPSADSLPSLPRTPSPSQSWRYPFNFFRPRSTSVDSFPMLPSSANSFDHIAPD